MAKNPITITTGDQGNDNLVVNFSREQFSDFVFSLTASPREERKVIFSGFDVTLDDLKVLVDKLNYQIRTQNDMLNCSMTGIARFAKNTEVVCNTYESFFHVEDLHSETPTSITVAISYVIGFTRLGNQKSYEKQIVQFTFFSGRQGGVEIVIRSSDLTWPVSIFSTIEAEVDAISIRTVGKQNLANSRLLFFAESIRKFKERLKNLPLSA